MELRTQNADMMNRRNQNQTGQTGGEKLKRPRILVTWIKWKIRTIIETTTGIARSFLKHLTYFFRRCFRTYVCPRHTSGFTLIEMLVVIAIIGILAGLLMPAVQKARQKGLTTKAKAMINQLELALSMYENDFGTYPVDAGGKRQSGVSADDYYDEHEEILELLTGKDKDDSNYVNYVSAITGNPNWKGPYLEVKKDSIKSMSGVNFLQDPWGTPYVIFVAQDRDVATVEPPHHNKFGVDIFSLGPDGKTDGDQEYNIEGDVLNLDGAFDGDSDSSTDSSNPRHDDINNW